MDTACFHLLAFETNAAMNVSVQMRALQFRVLQDQKKKYPTASILQTEQFISGEFKMAATVG